MTASEKFLFGTVGSPLSTPKKPGGTPGGILRMHELGLSTLELAWVQSVRVSDETCAVIKATAEQVKMPLSVHAPYYINLNAQTKDMLKAGMARLSAAASDIIFHPVSHMKEEPAKVYAIARQRLQDVADQLRDEKVNVTLRPETMGKSAMFGTLEETIELARDIDGVLPC